MGTFRLPVVPKPKMTVCVLGTEAHVSEAKALELGALVRCSSAINYGVLDCAGFTQ